MNASASIYPELIEILLQKTPCVLATVIKTQGSTPQKAGSSALIGINQLLAGTVGGGMTELKVIQQSQTIIESKKSGLFLFDLHGELAKGSDSICGGIMTILLDATPELHLPVFMQLKNSLEERRAGVLMTLVDESNPENIKINRFWLSETDRIPIDLKREFEPVIYEMLQNPIVNFSRIIAMKRMGICTKGFAFLESIVPKPSLIIAGAGHIGRSLAKLGKFLGFKVTVWDDRLEYASKNQIPDADIVLCGSLDSSLEQIEIQNDTYLVIVTRGHKNDAEVLHEFISKPLAYIGMIGSKAKVSQMKTNFLENGWASTEQWERIFTPVGLDIGAQTVEEIAISIAAQLVQVRNQKKGNPMNEIWSIVLAAGLSTRMGTQKLLLPFEGKTIIEKVVENILNSGIEHVMVVLGSDRAEISEALKSMPVHFVVNENFQEGMHTSVISGVKALPPEAKAVLLFLGDQPFIPARAIEIVAEAWKNSGKGIVIPLFEGKRGHPPLYNLKYRYELSNLDPNQGLRSIAQKFPDDICEVETFCPEIVRDIDTKKDYLNELNKTNNHGKTNSI